MTRYRQELPQPGDGRFLNYGGFEYMPSLQDVQSLHALTAPVMLRNEKKRERLSKYCRGYMSLARNHRMEFIQESATWRANRDRRRKIGPIRRVFREILH